jgi:hypothetical protein
MGINVQDVLAQDPELLQRQLYQQEMQRLNPQGNAAGAIGAVLGRGLGNVTRGRGFFDIADPALQKVAKIKELQTAALEQSGGDPVKTLEALSASLIQDPELAPFAFQVKKELMTYQNKTVNDPSKQARSNILRIAQIPEEERTEAETRLYSASREALGREAGEGNTVQSSKILEDGTVVKIYRNGERVVVDAEGNVVTGPEAANAVKEAAKFGVEIAGGKQAAQTLNRLSLEAQFAPAIAGGRKAGEIGQNISSEALKQTSLIRTNMNNLRDARRALQEGATTGVIASRFPDWKASTIELRNIQNRLGLDIVGSVTFGALSEGELKLALDTALPTRMEPPDLIKYIDRKIVAQDKLLNYFEEQARFLSKPGNTVQSWLENVDKKAAEKEKQAGDIDAKRRRLQQLREKARGAQ